MSAKYWVNSTDIDSMLNVTLNHIHVCCHKDIGYGFQNSGIASGIIQEIPNYSIKCSFIEGVFNMTLLDKNLISIRKVS